MEALKVAKGYVTELPCRKQYRGKRHIRVVYGKKIWELTQEYFRAGFEVQHLPYVVPCRELGADTIEYSYTN